MAAPSPRPCAALLPKPSIPGAFLRSSDRLSSARLTHPRGPPKTASDWQSVNCQRETRSHRASTEFMLSAPMLGPGDRGERDGSCQCGAVTLGGDTQMSCRTMHLHLR